MRVCTSFSDCMLERAKPDLDTHGKDLHGQNASGRRESIESTNKESLYSEASPRRCHSSMSFVSFFVSLPLRARLVGIWPLFTAAASPLQEGEERAAKRERELASSPIFFRLPFFWVSTSLLCTQL